MGSGDGGFPVPDSMTSTLMEKMKKQQMIAVQQRQQMNVKTQVNQLDQQLRAAIGPYLGMPNTPETQDQLKDMLQQELNKMQQRQMGINDLQRMLNDVEWYKYIRSVVDTARRGEELSMRDREKLCELLNGLQYMESIPKYRQQMYNTLLSRIESGEELIFIDYDVLDKLPEEINDLQVGNCNMQLKNVNFEDGRMTAEIQIEPQIPLSTVHVHFVIEETMIDRVVDKQIIPREVARRLVDKKMREVMKDVEAAVTRDARRLEAQRRMDYLAPFRTSMEDSFYEQSYPPPADRIAFKAYESAGKSVVNMRALARAVTT